MESRENWLLISEVLDQISAAGFQLSERQLERRRNKKLLPAADQEQFEQRSISRHPPITARQAIAVERCLATKDNFEFAGPLVWIAGFDVGESYYIGHLEQADRLFKTSRSLLVPVMKRLERGDQTIGDKLGPLSATSGLLAKISRRLDDQEKARFFNVIAEIATTDFDGFDREELGTSGIFTDAFDFQRGSNDRVMGTELRLNAALEGILFELSRSLPLRDFLSSEIRAERDNVRNALKIATCLHDAMAWIYGPTALGLRLVASFAQTMHIKSIFALIMGFARLRKWGANIYSSVEITEMAHQAEMTWLISTYFRDLPETRPDLAQLVTPQRMKGAFSEPAAYQNLLKELEAYQFPAPDFIPWNSWQKLAKKKMSPGLLAMSIGSPTRLSYSEVIEGAVGSVRR